MFWTQVTCNATLMGKQAWFGTSRCIHWRSIYKEERRESIFQGKLQVKFKGRRISEVIKASTVALKESAVLSAYNVELHLENWSWRWKKKKEAWIVAKKLVWMIPKRVFTESLKALTLHVPTFVSTFKKSRSWKKSLSSLFLSSQNYSPIMASLPESHTTLHALVMSYYFILSTLLQKSSNMYCGPEFPCIPFKPKSAKTRNNSTLGRR